MRSEESLRKEQAGEHRYGRGSEGGDAFVSEVTRTRPALASCGFPYHRNYYIYHQTCGRLVRGDGGLAQLVEHLLCKQGVNGSSPLSSTRMRSLTCWEREDEVG